MSPMTARAMYQVVEGTREEPLFLAWLEYIAMLGDQRGDEGAALRKAMASVLKAPNEPIMDPGHVVNVACDMLWAAGSTPLAVAALCISQLVEAEQIALPNSPGPRCLVTDVLGPRPS